MRSTLLANSAVFCLNEFLRNIAFAGATFMDKMAVLALSNRSRLYKSKLPLTTPNPWNRSLCRKGRGDATLEARPSRASCPVWSCQSIGQSWCKHRLGRFLSGLLAFPSPPAPIVLLLFSLLVRSAVQEHGIMVFKIGPKIGMGLPVHLLRPVFQKADSLSSLPAAFPFCAAEALWEGVTNTFHVGNAPGADRALEGALIPGPLYHCGQNDYKDRFSK